MRLSVLQRAAAGQETFPPLVLLHGLMAEAETFQHLMAELPAERRVLALDMPGAGYSERSLTADVGFRGMAASIREALSCLRVERPVLLGHSHGAAVAMQLAVSQPASLSALILLCPVHPFSVQEERLVNFYLSRPGLALAQLIPRLPRWLFLLAFKSMPGIRGHFDTSEIEPYRHTLRAPGTVEHLVRVLRRWSDDKSQLGRELQASPLVLPVLMILGERDIVVPARDAETLRPYLPGAESVLLPGVGHLPSEEVPEVCGRVICEWLSRQIKGLETELPSSL